MPTEELKHEEMAVKMQRDARRALQLELAMVRSCLHNDAEAERVEIRQKIAELQEKREAFVEKDDALKTRIEEIDAIGGGGDNNPGLKILRDERRMHKTTRQAYKVEMKSLSTQLAELNKKLQSVSEKEKATDERAQRRTDRARKRLRDEVNRNLTDNVRLIVPVKVRPPIGQRVWLLRAHMQPGWRFVVTGGCRISGKYVRYSLFAPEPVSEENSDGVDNDELFRLELYDAATCLCSENIVVSKLEWLALTKSHHEQQLLVPELAPVDSDVVKRLAELHEMLNEARQAFHHAKDTSSGVTSKGKTAKAKTSSKTKREELRGKMATASSEINKLHREAPWAVLVKALCERITLTSMPTATAYELALDRCIFRSTTAILRVSNDENEEGDGEPSVVYCRVRVEISALALAVIFMVWDPLSATEWRLEYPESRELVREFVVETFTEQQMHLEAIVMSLLLHLNTDTGQLELRFEE
ncbi:hypothetical protein PHYBOEH_005459 [Phytophthora boehmeriae]|uniref:Uncharacterized protein n=1 Tax=Phytophthora boehmeriae TaxID=109152 RepID=A0A8T1WP16_9STRA|nr:hypothetical protein PHYBOEH_005459 [Phytophthora boehmeriae]